MIRFALTGIIVLLTQLCWSQNKVDSLLNILAGKPEKEATGIYNQLAEEYTQTDTSQTIKYAQKAIRLAKANRQADEEQKALYYIGDAYYYANRYHSALKYYKEALIINKIAADSSFRADIYNSIGLAYYYAQNSEMAIQYYLKGLRMCEQMKLECEMPSFYSNIGMVHSRAGNYTDATKYYKKALEINTSLRILPSIGVNLNGIGVAYYNLQQYDSAKYYYQKALRVFKKTGNEMRQAVLLNNLATIYVNQKDSLDKALEYYIKAEAAFKQTGQIQNEANVLEGLGCVYREMSQYSKAISTFQACIELIQKNNLELNLLQINFSDLALTYEKMGNYAQALKYQKLTTQYADSVFNQEKITQIAQIEKQYETEKQKAEIGRLKAEQELAMVQLNKNRHIKIMGIISLVLLAVALFYISIRYYEKMRTTEMLAEKNAQISKSEEELKKLNSAKNKFFSIIAHDLKNPFHTIMGYSQLLSNNFDSFSEEEKKKFAENINISANTIFRLLHNLLEWSRTQTDQIIFAPVFIDFSNIYTNAVNYLRATAEQKNIDIVPDFHKDDKVFADPVMLETVLRNLVGNAIKFSQPEQNIIIRLTQNTEETRISVIDHGTGIQPEDLKNLFQIDSKIKRKGTNNEEGSGIGLLLCKEIIEKHGGNIQVESVLHEGSTFSVILPNKKIQPQA